MRRFAIYFLFALSLAGTLYAQNDTLVSIVTFFPGPEIYELEGHTVLRVRTPESDVAVSYGNFDFDSPNFAYRFVKGETDYRVDAYPWPLMLASYMRQGRRITEQQLDMSAEQKSRLIALLEENLLPQNRVYRYNYVRDNCATRPLAMVERAIGDSIVLGPVPDGMTDMDTWRKLMTHYHRNYPWYQLGIDMVLGSGLDRPLDNRAKAYAPALMAALLASATTGGRQLVSRTEVLLDTAEDSATEAPTPTILSPVIVLSFIAMIFTALAASGLPHLNLRRWAVCLLNLAVGICGLVLTFLIFVSSHEATSPNWLYLWLNPLALLIAVLVWIKKAEKLLLWAQIANFALITAMLLIWPFVGQKMNPALWPMIAADLVQTGVCVYILLHRNKCQEIKPTYSSPRS